MKPFDCLDQATQLKGHHLLEASAGTGKTFAIEHLTVRLLIEGVALDKILVVTFMRAATRELKMRIRQAINSALTALQKNSPPDLPYLKAVIKQGEEVRSAVILRLEQAQAFVEEAQIFTIHSFCARMLCDYAFEGSDHEKGEDRTYLLRAIDNFLRTSLHPDHFSQAQLSALLKKHRGNYKTLSAKLATLIQAQGDFPSYPSFKTSHAQFCQALQALPSVTQDDLEELAPFFNKMCDRSGQIKPSFLSQIAHFHPTCCQESFDKLLKEKESVLELFDLTNRKKRVRGELPPKATHFFLLKEKLLPLIKSAYNPLCTLIRIAKQCQEELNAQGALKEGGFSPDDALTQMVDYLTSSPFFLHSIQTRYQAAIIDEFQDTDSIQWEIFRRLFIDNAIETLYLVGDPKQSIYSFRDADINAYFQATAHIKKKDYLTTNYRSTPALLNALNALFSKNPTWLALPDCPLNCPAVLVPKTAKDAPFPDDKESLCFLLIDPNKELLALEKELLFPFIATEITFLKEKAHISLDQIALLIKDRYQARRLKAYLNAHNIPVATKGGASIADSTSYSLWRTLLQALIHKDDLRMAAALLAHPLLPSTDRDLLDQELLAKVRALLRKLSRLFEKKGVSAMITSLLKRVWIEEKTVEALVLWQGGVEAVSDFRQVTSLLIEYAFERRASLLDCLNYLDTLPERGLNCLKPLPIANLAAVPVMTTYMSKGLEFDVVFALSPLCRQKSYEEIVRARRKWTLIDKKEEGDHILLRERQAEELRKFYVALTRAKKRLYLPVNLDPTKTPTAHLSSSSIELFFSKLPPLQEVIPAIGASSLTLEETVPTPLNCPSPSLLLPRCYQSLDSPHPLHSFSSLTQVGHQRLEGTLSLQKREEEGLPKGTKTGLALHALLEMIIRARKKRGHKSLPHLVDTFLRGHPLELFANQIKEMITATFRLKLLDFSLEEVPPLDFHPEVEFFFPRPTESVKGFIDLIFSYRGVYYFIDWKSNALNDTSHASLEEAMHAGHYFLQAKLYFEALERHLALFHPSPPIGGGFYLFLRALPKKEGIYFIKKKEECCKICVDV